MMKDKALTKIQAKVLKFVERHIATKGYAPTRHEIRAAFGWASPTSAEDHLRAIQKKGRIHIPPGKLARAIVVL